MHPTDFAEWTWTLFIQQRANLNLTWSLRLLRVSTLQYSTEPVSTYLHQMSIKVVQRVAKSTATGSGRITYFRCSKSSLVWWVPRPLGGAHGGYGCDFRYGSCVCLPTSGGCLLLWHHLSRRALLTACDTPPDGLSWPEHFAEPTAHSKGQGGLGDSCNYTPRGVNHPRENTVPWPSRCSRATPTQRSDFERACAQASRCVCMLGFFFVSQANILQ